MFAACGDSASTSADPATEATVSIEETTPTRTAKPTTCREAVQAVYDQTTDADAESNAFGKAVTVSLKMCRTVAQYQKASVTVWGQKDNLALSCKLYAPKGLSICDGVDTSNAAVSPPPDDSASAGTGDNYAIKAAIDGNIGSGETDYGASRAATVDCQERSCIIHYNADTPPFDPEGKLLDGTRPIFQAAFESFPKADVQITVGGQTTSVGGKQSVDDALIITCSPEANKQIDWTMVDAGGLKALCEYQPLVTFK